MNKSITLKKIAFTNFYNETVFVYNSCFVFGSFLKKNVIDWQGQMSPDSFRKCILNRKVSFATKEQIANKEHVKVNRI